MRITFVISSLTSGGAERVMSTMANYWAQKGWEVTLITLGSRESDFYALGDGVKRVALDLLVKSTNPLSAMKNNLARVMRLRKSICESKPDAVISFIDRTNVLTLLAVIGLGLNVVISERTDPAVHRIGKVWDVLRKLTYPRASAIVVQSATVQNWLKRTIRKTVVNVIPNPISLKELTGMPDKDAPGIKENSEKILMAMGRLGPEKGFDLLIKAFFKTARRYPDWRLLILGEGNERKSLEGLIKELGLTGRVFLPGRVRNPVHFLKQADIFAMSSRREGFPNALLEAMACGLPVISFDCPSGPRELIRNGIDGLLVPSEDIDALADAIAMLIENERMRSRLAFSATDVLERFGMEKVMTMWEKTILGPYDEK